MLDENEFLSPYGIRALSRIHQEHPYVLRVERHGVPRRLRAGRIDAPACSAATRTGAGRSGSRSTILLIEALQKFHHYFGDDFKVECPTGSGSMMTLWEVAAELSRRLTRIFLRDADGRRPVHGGDRRVPARSALADLVLFYEYFHGDNGAGVGASHQTGWTGLVAKLLQQSGERSGRPMRGCRFELRTRDDLR